MKPRRYEPGQLLASAGKVSQMVRVKKRTAAAKYTKKKQQKQRQNQTVSSFLNDILLFSNITLIIINDKYFFTHFLYTFEIFLKYII